MTKLSLVVVLVLVSLKSCSVKGPSSAVPEDALISRDRYTNAFFGFSLPLPPDPAFHVVPVISSRMGEHNLFGLGQEKGNTTFVISAQQMLGRDAEKAMLPPHIVIRGKEFSKWVSQPQKTSGGTVWKVMYATATDIYLIYFEIQSSDPKMVDELERCVEETTFFDPAQARAVAGVNATPYNPTLARHPKN